MTISELHQLFLRSKGICTDTRKIDPGTMFFALKGANFNGNDFAMNALEEGCFFAVVDEPQLSSDDRIILVDNVLKSLQQLANFHRHQFNIPVLGITGSNGKTTTKELIGVVLKKKFNLLMTEGNLNNHLGVPLTLLKLNTSHDFALIEMGANKPGDIQELVEIAEPNFGIITNIGAAHIEGFGSIEGVIETKTALYRWIDKVKGVLFVNADDKVLQEKLPDVKCITYGFETGEVSGHLIKLDPFVHFEWCKDGYRSPEIATQLVGRYNFANFLAAVAIGDFFGVEAAKINEALQQYQPSNNRSQVQRTERNTLIVDCYNANATSMAAAIESFAEVNHPKKLAILGDMLELGAISDQEHQKMVALLKKFQLDAILVGKEFAKVKCDFPRYQNYVELLHEQDLSKISNHFILLKGSRGIKLENLISNL